MYSKSLLFTTISNLQKKIELNNCNQSQIQMFLNIRCFQVGWNTPAFLKECFILPKILFGS